MAPASLLLTSTWSIYLLHRACMHDGICVLGQLLQGFSRCLPCGHVPVCGAMYGASTAAVQRCRQCRILSAVRVCISNAVRLPIFESVVEVFFRLCQRQLVVVCTAPAFVHAQACRRSPPNPPNTQAKSRATAQATSLHKQEYGFCACLGTVRVPC